MLSAGGIWKGTKTLVGKLDFNAEEKSMNREKLHD